MYIEPIPFLYAQLYLVYIFAIVSIHNKKAILFSVQIVKWM